MGGHSLHILVVGSVVSEKDQNLGLPLKRAYVCFITMHQKLSGLCIETDINHKPGEIF